MVWIFETDPRKEKDAARGGTYPAYAAPSYYRSAVGQMRQAGRDMMSPTRLETYVQSITEVDCWLETFGGIGDSSA